MPSPLRDLLNSSFLCLMGFFVNLKPENIGMHSVAERRGRRSLQVFVPTETSRQTPIYKNRATREEWRGFQISVVLVEYLAHGKLKNHDQGSKPNQNATDQRFDGELLV